MNLAIRGTEQVAKAIKEAASRFPSGLGVGLYKAGATILAEAIKRAPVEFGTLRRSGYVSLPSPKNRPRVEAGFGVKYAARQEMEGGYNHPRGGEAHYLRNAVAATSSAIAGALPGWAAKAALRGEQAGSGTFPTRPVVGAGGQQRAKFKRAARNMTKRFTRK